MDPCGERGRCRYLAIRVDFAAPAQSAIHNLGEQRPVALIDATVLERLIEQNVGIGFLRIDFEQNLAGDWRTLSSAFSAKAITGFDPRTLDKLYAGQLFFVFQLNLFEANDAGRCGHPKPAAIGANDFAGLAGDSSLMIMARCTLSRRPFR